MRIGLFSDSYYPYTSGVVTSIATVKDELMSRGHDVHIFAPNYPNYHVKEKNVHRFFSVPAPTNPDFSLMVPVSPRLNMVVKQLELDLIHVHSPFILGQMGAKCARKYDLPLVFTYHTQYDQYVHYFPIAQDLARELTVKYSKYFCNKCDLVIAPSCDLESLIRSYGINTPIRVLPTGVDADYFGSGDREWLRRTYGIPKSKKICLFVGRLSFEKNIEFLIQTMRLIKEKTEDVCLVIVASGPQEKELKRMAVGEGLELDRDIVFAGFLPREQLVHAYNGADLFTFASVTETQGIVLVEAMAAGLPVVAVRATGTRDMVQDGVQGILTDEDVPAFADSILRVLGDRKLYARMAAAGPKRAQVLSSKAMAEKLEAEYMSLIEYTSRRNRKWAVNSWIEWPMRWY